MRNITRMKIALVAIGILAMVAGCGDDLVEGPTLVASDMGCGDGYGDTRNCGDAGGEIKSPCDDSNPCTIDLFDAAGKCIHQKAGDATTCDDNDLCTELDACLDGVCRGLDKACGDDNPCTTDSCTKGTCKHANADANCDDGSICTVGDLCKAGACLPGTAQNCDDSNLCTTDSCDKTMGCKHAPKDCSDNNPCTADNCAPATGSCSNPPISGVACDDNNPGTITDTCNAGVCAGTKPPEVVCDDKNACTTDGGGQAAAPCTHTAVICDDANPCTVDTCAPKTGCVFTNTNTLCDDGSACTIGDQCVSGNCKPGIALVCNDNSLCTLDACDPTKGCVNANLTGTACNDGDACTANDICSAAGICVGGPGLSCDDNNVCTTDSCDPAKGGCQNIPILGTACNDNDATTINDICSGGGKCKGSSVACDDGNVCTVDGGNTPNCTHTTLVCNDSNPCTSDSCDPVKGCTFLPSAGTVACDDNNVCTSGDVCSNGACNGGPKNCDDGNPCTADSCNKVVSGGCTHAALSGVACDDKDQYTNNDVCGSGVCKGSAIACDDSNLCTTDSGNAPNCTASPIVCDDKFPCTSDTCDPAKGCVFSPAAGTVTCDDSNPCTSGDACSGGTCVGGAPKNCDDGNPCTADSCNKGAGGCLYALLSGGVCDDASQYTVNDICTMGVCKGTPIPCDDGNKCTTDSGNAPTCTYSPILCDDGNLCTSNSCDSSSGCVFLPAAGTITCNDGNICTLNDVCASGTCISGATSKCDDGDPCTVDACDPKTGACKYSALLINGKQCGIGEICANGIDDDGDLKVDCQDSECNAAAKAIVLHSYGPPGATVEFVTADKPGVVQPLPVGAWQIYCKELPVKMTVKSVKYGTLFAWVEGPSGTTPEEKILSAPQFWAFDIFWPIYDQKPAKKAPSFQKDESFKIIWPPSK